jgi:hypothetical protein
MHLCSPILLLSIVTLKSAVKAESQESQILRTLRTLKAPSWILGTPDDAAFSKSGFLGARGVRCSQNLDFSGLGRRER